MMDRWPLLGTVCAFCVGTCAPALAAPPEPTTMERAQREADGPKRRILEAARARDKAVAKAEAATPRAKVATDAASAAGASKAPAPATAATTGGSTDPATMVPPAAAPGAAAALRAETVAAVKPQLPTAVASSPALDVTRSAAPPALTASPPARIATPPPTPTSTSMPMSMSMSTPQVTTVALAAPRLAAEEAYAADLSRLVDGLKRYPTTREARTLRPQGTVQVWLEVDRSGQLLQVGVAASSGAPLLDGEALRSVRAGRYAPFPEGAFDGQASRRFQVAIEYRTEGG